MSYYIMKPSQSSLLFFQAFLTRSEQKEGLFLCSHSFCFEPFLHFLWQWDWIKRRRKRNKKNNKIALIYFTGVKRKLIEWILYSLDVEMAQKLPIAVSSGSVFTKQTDEPAMSHGPFLRLAKYTVVWQKKKVMSSVT